MKFHNFHETLLRLHYHNRGRKKEKRNIFTISRHLKLLQLHDDLNVTLYPRIILCDHRAFKLFTHSNKDNPILTLQRTIFVEGKIARATSLLVTFPFPVPSLPCSFPSLWIIQCKVGRLKGRLERRARRG